MKYFGTDGFRGVANEGLDVEHAIKGMLPHTSLGRQQATKLKVYAGPEHPHAAQNPVKIDLEA